MKRESCLRWAVCGVVVLVLGSIAGTAAGASWFCPDPTSPPPPGGAGGGGDPGPKCSTDCGKQHCTGSPCFAGTGLYGFTTTDLQLPGGLEVSRSYMSGRVLDGLAGPGWRLNLTARLFYATYLFAAPSTYRTEADVTMPDGSPLRFKQNTDGSFTPPAGRKDTLVRNGDGSFDLTLQQSRVVYHFRTDGSLATITDEAGNVVTYTYDVNGRLQRIADSVTGRFLDVTFGSNGRISSIQDSSGRSVSYGYDPSTGMLTSVTDPASRQTKYEYQQGRFGKLLWRVRDNWDRLVTQVTYDAQDRTKTYTENGETWTYTNYAPTTATKTDSSGNVWNLTFTSDGLITTRAVPPSAGVPSTLASYYADGSIQQTTDATGIKTFYTYDAAGHVQTVTKNYQGASAVRYDYTYDPAFPDKVASVTPKNPSTNVVDTNWQAWRYDYWPSGSNSPGALHNVTRVKSDGTTLETTATYEYDTKGRMTRQTTALGAQTDYAFDPATGNLLSVTAPANNDAGTRPATTYGYDSTGRVTSVTDPNGKTTSYVYDGLGRVQTVTLPKPSTGSLLNFTTTYSYDNFDLASGLLFTNVTDANGKVTKLGYDAFGRLVKSIDAANNATTYAYTKDVLTSITDANGNVTSYQYDVLRRLTRTTFPDLAFETYTYWADGSLHTKTDRKSQTLTYAYDPFKRLTTKTYPGATSIAYTYVGQKLTQVTDSFATPDETHTFAYDSSYRVQSNTQGPRGTLNYTYTADDRVQTTTIQSGSTATYAYYPDGSLNTVTWSPVAGIFKYAYTPLGQYQTVTFPNGQSRTYGYDDQGRLTQLSSTLSTTTLATYAYGYDRNQATGQDTMLGQRSSMTATVPAQGLNNAQSKYYYDPLYQLTRADYPSGAPFNGEVHQWTYDAIGNRLTNTVNASTQTYAYLKNGANPLNSQRLSNDGVSAYTWDNNGSNLTRNGAPGNFTFGYDPDNRLSSISGAATASYTYDYQGRRTSKIVAGVATTYLYDGLNLVRETVGGTPADYAFGPSIDEPLAQYRSGAISYFDADGLGTIAVANDSAGTATVSTSFDAWGVARTETGTRVHPFTYTGREVGEAGLQFSRARFLQSAVGRFTQEDPIKGRDLPLAYSYAANNPIVFTDPTGMRECSTDPVMTACLAKLLIASPQEIKNVRVHTTKEDTRSRIWAITNVNEITLHIPCETFYENRFVVLEEYYHVLKQWNNHRMNVITYGIGSLLHPFSPYKKNPWEVEAKDWAGRNLDAFEECIECSMPKLHGGDCANCHW